MTSVQERLQLKRIALDKWTVREQLCLASAVSCSGDQNWMSVSRSLKMLCGANRPADWFSQKSCAVQYGELLENVETPKRKKRMTNERDTQTTAETPTESILRKLTLERVAELKSVIQAEQEEYAKLREEILALQSGGAEENLLREMWAQIEHETEQKLAEKQKHEQWLKEREERKLEMQKVSRVAMFLSSGVAAQSKPPQLSLAVKQEDLDVDDSSTKQGSSPLLTSLLKSPATTPTSTSSPTNIRVSAPTITNLLTGNSSSVVAVGTTSSDQSFQIIQNQPLTGPVRVETPQPAPTPSQTAPTLSMLLENKNANKPSTSAGPVVEEIKKEEDTNEPEPMETEDGSCSPNKDEEQQLMEVFKGLIPDNIDEEFEEILTNNNGILLEEESILENVESLIDEQEETKATQEQSKTTAQSSKNLQDSTATSESKDDIKKEDDALEDVKVKHKIEDSSGGGFQATNSQPVEVKDESEQEATEAKDTDTETVSSGTDDTGVQIIEPEDIKTDQDGTTDTKPSDEAAHADDTIESSKQDLPQIEVPEDSDKAPEEEESKEPKSPEKSQDIQEEAPIEVDAGQPLESANELISETTSDHTTTTITIIDTDEDSTMEVIKEEKRDKAKRDYSRKKPEQVERRLDDIDENRLSISLRKLKDRDGSESPLVDDETSDSMPRTRRRYSSTPNIDSIPNSPASSDDREYKAWKKSILSVYNNRLSSQKYASVMTKAQPEDSGPNYKEVVLRPMDLQTIKQRIESGLTRTSSEFQRDVMLMCQNAIMYHGKDSDVYSMAKELMTETAMSIDSLVENARKEVDLRSSTSSMKNRSRKSTRLP